MQMNKRDVKDLLNNSIVDTQIYYKKYNVSVANINSVLSKFEKIYLENLKDQNPTDPAQVGKM